MRNECRRPVQRTCMFATSVGDFETPLPAMEVDLKSTCALLRAPSASSTKREYGIERAIRDARLGRIGGGTDELMKEILGKTMEL